MRLRLILYLASCICVPSPQSIRKLSSMVCNTWAVGLRSNAGMAELFPKMVSANTIIDLRFMVCGLMLWFGRVYEIRTVTSNYKHQTGLFISKKFPLNFFHLHNIPCFTFGRSDVHGVEQVGGAENFFNIRLQATEHT